MTDMSENNILLSILNEAIILSQKTSLLGGLLAVIDGC